MRIRPSRCSGVLRSEGDTLPTHVECTDPGVSIRRANVLALLLIPTVRVTRSKRARQEINTNARLLSLQFTN